MLVTSTDSNENKNINEIINNYQTVADLHKSTKFFISTRYNDEVKNFLNHTNNNIIKKTPFIARIEPNENILYLDNLNDLNDYNTVLNFIIEYNIPIFAKLGMHNFYNIATNPKRKLAIGFLSNNKDKDDKFIKELRNCALEKYENEHNFFFGYLEDKLNIYVSFIQGYIDDMDTLPRLVVLDSKAKMYYVDFEKEKENGLCKFLDLVTNDEIPYYREGILGYPWKGVQLTIKYFPLSLVPIGIGLVILYIILKAMCCDAFLHDEEEIKKYIDDLKKKRKEEQDNKLKPNDKEDKKNN